VRAALVISPHLDDAALSCGQFLAGRPDAVVVTVFAGIPKAKTTLTSYDRDSGFRSSHQAMESRRAEDREALAVLGAMPVHLGFTDHQYGQPMDRGQVAAAVAAQVVKHNPELVVAPLGLGHPDHELVREATLDVLREDPVPLWLFEDTPTCVLHPELVPPALGEVAARGLTAEPGFIGDGPLAQKMAALWCYRSQLPMFDNHHTLLCPERFWHVTKAVTPEDN
jgi:LmbE family N-acetylglucosaminyl deacetylase